MITAIYGTKTEHKIALHGGYVMLKALVQPNATFSNILGMVVQTRIKNVPMYIDIPNIQNGQYGKHTW